MPVIIFNVFSLSVLRMEAYTSKKIFGEKEHGFISKNTYVFAAEYIEFKVNWEKDISWKYTEGGHNKLVPIFLPYRIRQRFARHVCETY